MLGQFHSAPRSDSDILSSGWRRCKSSRMFRSPCQQAFAPTERLVSPSQLVKSRFSANYTNSCFTSGHRSLTAPVLAASS